ncbi:MAG: hypothetical protein WC471_03665 [Candidatus Woesearchaeota archaeon]
MALPKHVQFVDIKSSKDCPCCIATMYIQEGEYRCILCPHVEEIKKEEKK